MAILKTNSRLYEGVDLTLSMLGNVDVKGFKELSYEADRPNAKLEYGQGVNNIGHTMGMRSFTGQLEMYAHELRAIERAAKTNGYRFLDEMPAFDLACTLLNEDQGFVTDLLICKFTNSPRGARTEDAAITHVLNLLVLDIKIQI